MVQDSHGRKHVEGRRRKNSKSTGTHLILDKLIYVVAIIAPLMTIPQVLQIWLDRNALGVNILSWGAYMIIAFVWIIYGIIHRQKPIVFSSILWLILDILIVAGVLIYG